MYQSRTALINIITKYEGEELRAAVQGIDNFDKEIRDSITTFKAYEQQMEDIRETMRVFADTQSTTSDHVLHSATAYAKLETAARKAFDELALFARANKELGNTFEISAEESEKLQQQFRDFEASAEDAINPTKLLENALRELNAEIKLIEDKKLIPPSFEQEIDKAADDVRKLEKAERELAQQSEKTGNELKQAGDKARGLGKDYEDSASKIESATKYIGASIIGATTFALFNFLEDQLRAVREFVTEAGQEWAEYDFMVRQVFAQAPGVTLQFREEVTETAMIVGEALGYLPEEVMPTIRKGLNLGLDEDNIFTAIESAAQAARVSGADLEETLVRAISVNQAYGDGVYSVTEILDQFAFVTQNSVLEQQDLNQGLGAIVNVAAEAGIELSELSGMIVTMSNQGGSMNEIQDYLVNTLTQITITGSALGGLFEEAAGVPFKEYIAGGNTFIDALDKLRDHADATGNSLLQMAGGDSNFYRDIQSALGLLELTGIHANEMRVNTLEAGKAMGGLATAASEMDGSLLVLMKQTDSAKQSFKLLMGEALEPQVEWWTKLKKGAYDYGIELLRNQKINRENLAANEAAWANYEKIIDDLSYELEFMTRGSDDASIALQRLQDQFGVTPNESTTKDIVEDYAAALTLFQTLLKADPDTTWEEFLVVFENRLRGVTAAVEEFDPAWRAIANTPLVSPEQREAQLAQLEEYKQAILDLVVTVQEVKDGDTFQVELKGELIDVRLAGVDTPETAKEWADTFREQLGMPYGDEAMEFTQDLLVDGKVTLGPQLGESFERSVNEVFVDGKRLSTILAGEGLALPAFMDIDNDRVQREILSATRIAAEAGRGMFENHALRQAYLEGELRKMSDIYDIFPGLQVAAESYTAAWASADDEIEGVLEAMELLKTADDPEQIAELSTDLDKSLKDLKDYYHEYTAEIILANQGATDSSIGVLVALGAITEQEAIMRTSHAQTIEAIDAFAVSQDAALLSDEARAAGLELIIEGYAKTAEAAIRAAERHDEYQTLLEGGFDPYGPYQRAYSEIDHDIPMPQVQFEFEPHLYDDEFYEQIEALKTHMGETLGTPETPFNLPVDVTMVPDLDDYNTQMEPVFQEIDEWDKGTYVATIDEEGGSETYDTLRNIHEKAIEVAGKYTITVEIETIGQFPRVPGDNDSGYYDPAPGGSGISGGYKPPGGYYVGEDGPEYVYFPRPAQIIPNNELGPQQNITMNVNMTAGTNILEGATAAREMARALKRYGL